MTGPTTAAGRRLVDEVRDRDDPTRVRIATDLAPFVALILAIEGEARAGALDVERLSEAMRRAGVLGGQYAAEVAREYEAFSRYAALDAAREDGS